LLYNKNGIAAGKERSVKTGKYLGLYIDIALQYRLAAYICEINPISGG